MCCYAFFYVIVFYVVNCCDVLKLFLCFFFFNRKTAYGMRISDWSSDVCSSDLSTAARASARSTRTWASADPPASNGVRHHSTRQGPLLQGGQRLVEGLARTHHRCGLGVVGGVVAADVDRRALHRQELVGDLGLLLGEELGQRGDLRGQVGVVGLRGQGLRPVERQVEVAAPVVELVDLE